jgi:hypothetical protein
MANWPEWPLIIGDILAIMSVSCACYSLHERIESSIAKLEGL